MPHTEKRYKKGEIICRPKEMVMSMYNILYGSVGIYFDYGTPEQVDVVTLREGDFFNVISFLESRPRNTTVVALEPLVVSEITMENFGKYFSERPAKIMSLMQYMSKRMRVLTRGYLEASQALEEYADAERLLKERKDWYEEHKDLYHRIMGLFGFD